MDHRSKNIEVMKEMIKGYKMPWEDIWRELNWGVLASSFRIRGGGCSKCGKPVTSLNIRYFRFDVSRVLCYECQEELKNNKINRSWPKPAA